MAAGRTRNNRNNRSRNRDHGDGNGNGNGNARGNSVSIVVDDPYHFESIAQYFNHWAVESEGRYPWTADREHLRIVVPRQWITNSSKKEINRLGGSLGDRP